MKKKKKTTNIKDKKLNIWLFAGFFAALSLSSPWFDLNISNHAFVKSYFGGIGSLILFMLLIWYRRRNLLIEWQLNPIKISLFAVFAFATLSVFWNVNIDFFITKWLLFLIIFMSFVVASDLEINQQNLVNFAWSILIGGLIISGIGVLQFLFDPFPLTQAAVPSSTFGNRNMATQPLLFMLPMTLFLLFSPLNRGWKVWLLSVIATMMIVFIFYTTTRGAWIAVLAQFLFIATYMVFNHRKIRAFADWNREKLNAVIFAIIASLTLMNFSSSGWTPMTNVFSGVADKTVSNEEVYTGVEDEIEDKKTNKEVDKKADKKTDKVADKNIVETKTADESLLYKAFKRAGGARFGIWEVAINMIKDSPILGTGLGSWYENESAGGYATLNVSTYQRVHNDTLELAIEIGLLGLFVFLLAIVALTVASFQIIKRSSEQIGWFYFLALAALVGSFVNMQFSFPYQMVMPLVLFGWFSGLISTQANNVVKPIKTIKLQLSSTYKNLILGFWTILAVVVLVIYAQWINAFSELNRIHIESRLDKLTETVQTPVYHMDMQTVLNFLGNHYFNYGLDKKVLQVNKEIFTHWSMHPHTLRRQAYSQYRTRQYEKALKNAAKLKTVSPPGYYEGHMIEFVVYRAQKNTKKARDALEKIINEPPELLGLFHENYSRLLAYTAKIKELRKYTVQMYKNYVKYHGYSCQVENNIAIYYYQDKDYKRAAAHMQKTQKEGCGHSIVLKELIKLGLLKEVVLAE